MKAVILATGVSRRLLTYTRETPIRPADRFLVFNAPLIEDAVIEEVVASMRSGWLGTGPKVARFEDGCYDEQADNRETIWSLAAILHRGILVRTLERGV